jgi:hypothetical protein
MKTQTKTGSQILDDRHLEIRARILELAAEFDRVDRCGGAADDSRMALIRSAIEQLLDGPSGGKAEKVQLLFSDPYEKGWKVPAPRI